MSVNLGGLGSNIRFSDLQAFYGGEHPISLSEYYRGGGEVPSTVLSGNNPYTGTTNFPASGSGTGGNHGIAVTVTTTAGGPGDLTVTNRFAGAGAIGFTTVRPDRIEFGTIRITSDTSFARVQYVNGQSTTDAARGPAWVNGDSGLGLSAAQVAALPMRAVGAAVTGSGGNGASLVFNGTGRATRGAATPDTHDISFTNNTGQRITFVDAETTGNPGTLNPGESAQVQNDGSSPSWEFEYNYVDAGSGSGTGDETNAGIVTDVTTVPGQTTTSGPVRGRVDFRDVPFTTSESYTVRSDDAFVVISVGGGDPDRGTNLRYSINGTNFTARDGNQSATTALYGPSNNQSYSGFIGFAPSEQGRRVNAGDVVRYVGGGRGTGELNVYRVTSTTTPTTYDVSYRNNNSDAVVLSGSTTPVGAGQTLAANGGMVSTTGLSSPNWSFQYRYAPSSQPANTAIPTSGEIELDQFNAPGNAAP